MYNKKNKVGSGNDMQKYPRIIDYLEDKHEKVAKLFNRTAMHGSLLPKRSGAITFLRPDTKYIEKIEKAIKSKNPEEATDMLSSLILPDLYEKPSDFSERQDDIPNLLGRKIIFKGVSGNKVMIDDGELELDTDFKPFERQGNSQRGNLAVWKLKGEVKYKDAPKSTYKYAKPFGKKAPKVEGGCEHKLGMIVDKIVQDEILAVANGTPGEGGYKSPMLNAVTRILRVLESNSNFTEEYLKARSLLTKHPVIDFYLLFQAFDIFSPTQIFEAYQMGTDINNNVTTVSEFFSKTVSSDPAGVLNSEELSKIIQASFDLREDVQSRIIKLNEKIIQAYKESDETNKLVYEGKVYYDGPVYPAVLASIFRANPGMHLALDEHKFMIYRCIRKIRSSTPNWDKGRKDRAEAYLELFNNLKCIGKLGNPKMSMIFRPRLDINDVYQSNEFWREFGLHFPTSNRDEFSGEASDRVIRGGNESLDLYSKEIINVNGEIADELQGYDNSDISLSENTVNELKAYLKAHDGKYPTL